MQSKKNSAVVGFKAFWRYVLTREKEFFLLKPYSVTEQLLRRRVGVGPNARVRSYTVHASHPSLPLREISYRIYEQLLEDATSDA